jgi:hypothetical protein
VQCENKATVGPPFPVPGGTALTGAGVRAAAASGSAEATATFGAALGRLRLVVLVDMRDRSLVSVQRPSGIHGFANRIGKSMSGLR